MRRRAGQVARVLAWPLRHLLQIALGFLLAAVLATGALAWRLAQGPLEITGLARRLEQAINGGGPGQVRIGAVALAWDGFHLGADHSLDIRLTDISVTNPKGTNVAALSRAEFSVSLGRLLLGRVVPRAVEIDGLRLAARRDANGAVSLEFGDLPARLSRPSAANGNAPDAAGDMSDLLRDLRQPPEGDGGRALSRWAQLQWVHVHDASVTVDDRQIGAAWSAPKIEIDVRRRAGGGLEGEADADFSIGTERLHLTAQAAPAPDGPDSFLRVKLSPENPRALAAAAPGLGPLSALDATVTLSAVVMLSPALRPRSAGLAADLGAGQIHIGGGALPLLGASVSASLDAAESLAVTLGHLDVAARPDGPRTRVTATLAARPEGDHFSADLAVDLDQAAFADLGVLWPTGLGGKGTKPWITKNITAGLAKNFSLRAGFAVPADFSDAILKSISGGVDATDLTVNWLRPVPPFEHADGRLTFLDTETIDIAVRSGHQDGGTQGGVVIRGGDVRITGIIDKDQFIDIDCDLAGPVADLLAVLKNPRIHLLDRRPIPMTDPSGKFDGHLAIARLPLRDNVSMDDLRINSTAHLTNVHLGGIAAGRDLDHATLDLRASNDGLHVQGTARVIAIPAQFAVDMDFRDGPPTQTLLAAHATGTVDAARMADAGLDPSGIIAGPVTVALDYDNRRGGAGSVALHADLSRTDVNFSRANVSKAAGVAATADMHVTLNHDHLVSIDHVDIEGGGISVEGAADIADGHPSVLRLTRIKIGATTDAHGKIQLPARDGDPYVVALEGPSLDVSGELKGSGTKDENPATPPKPEAEKRGSPYRVDMKFDRMLAAGGAVISGVAAHVENDGWIINRADVLGATGPAAPFHLSIDPIAGGRRLAATVADLGTLLRDLDVLGELQAGAATLSGAYDDTRPGHTLSGTLDVRNFRVRDAPLLGKLLQAMTLYGIADALSGPGLNFSRLIAPLTYSGRVLRLRDARAFSSSLGMTARGDLDLSRQTVNISGTVVPAYFFNSLLGDIPLIGKLFTAERGGGLFAANYSVHGPLDDPSVGVNPLSILTPGFLRGVFDGIGDEKTATRAR